MSLAARISLLLLATLPALAQMHYDWTVDTTRPYTIDYPVYHGETIILSPAYKSYADTISLTNLTSATFYWQTNNMQNAWWSKPAEILIYNSPGTPDRIRATFAPTNDCGAASYNFHIRATSASGNQYRALGTLSMRHSPGFIPATIPNPELFPGLATQLAPYVIPLLPPSDPLGTAASVSNSLTAAIATLATNHIDKLWLSPTRYTTADGRQWQIAREKGYKVISTINSLFTGRVFTPENDQWPTDDTDKNYYSLGLDNPLQFFNNVAWSLNAWPYEYSVAQPWDSATLTMTDRDNKTMTLQRVDHTLTNLVTTFATTNDIAFFKTDIDVNSTAIDTLQTALVTRVWHADHAAYIQDATLHSVSNFPATYTVTTSPGMPFPLGLSYAYSHTITPSGNDYYKSDRVGPPPNLIYSPDYAGFSFGGSWSDPHKFTTAKKTSSTLIFDTSIGLVHLTRTDHTVTNTAALATEPYVANALNAQTFNFQDCLLYTTPGTNYYFRWSDTNQTYTVTGVPQ